MENNKIRQEMIVEDVFDSLKEMKEEIDSALGLADEMKKTSMEPLAICAAITLKMISVSQHHNSIGRQLKRLMTFARAEGPERMNAEGCNRRERAASYAGPRLDVLGDIAKHYGLDHQKYKLVEEMAELTQALMKDDEDSILEEMADVTILLEQLKHLLFSGCEERKRLYYSIRQMKISRQLKRIKEEEDRKMQLARRIFFSEGKEVKQE